MKIYPLSNIMNTYPKNYNRKETGFLNFQGAKSVLQKSPSLNNGIFSPIVSFFTGIFKKNKKKAVQIIASQQMHIAPVGNVLPTRKLTPIYTKLTEKISETQNSDLASENSKVFKELNTILQEGDNSAISKVITNGIKALPTIDTTASNGKEYSMHHLIVTPDYPVSNPVIYDKENKFEILRTRNNSSISIIQESEDDVNDIEEYIIDPSGFYYDYKCENKRIDQEQLPISIVILKELLTELNKKTLLN